LDERDIERLELQHLNLQTGKLHVPGGNRRKEARTLNLEAHQILQLHHYIENHRDKQTEKLISPQANNFTNLHDQFKALNSQIRALAAEMNCNIVRLNQLRQSRITLWIKQYGLRKTQYMAGFKRVENVERYRQHDSEDLKQYVLQFHPLQ
jgi:integrase/recombinase XerD